MNQNIKIRPFYKFAVFLIVIVLLIFALREARNILYPLAFGGLFAYLLYPLCNFLEKKSVHRILANLISIITAIIVLSGIIFLFYNQLSNMFEDFDTIKQNATQNIEKLQQYLNEKLGLSDDRLEQALKEQIDSFFGAENGELKQLFSSTTGTLGRIIILPVYVFLFLYYRTKFAYFILKIVDPKDKRITIKILRDISTVAARYMGGVLIVVLILCVLNSTGLLIIGVEYAFLLGITSAAFNFIPYFGTLMGGSIPLIFVLLATTDPFSNALKVIILFVIIQFTENNILTPNIVGGNVKLNPFFVIVGLVIGAAIWGIPGMLLIIPVLAIARIIAYNIHHLKPYAFLLGPRGTQKHSITMKKIRNKFHFSKKASDLVIEDDKEE